MNHFVNLSSRIRQISVDEDFVAPACRSHSSGYRKAFTPMREVPEHDDALMSGAEAVDGRNRCWSTSVVCEDQLRAERAGIDELEQLRERRRQSLGTIPDWQHDRQEYLARARTIG